LRAQHEGLLQQPNRPGLADWTMRVNRGRAGRLDPSGKTAEVDILHRTSTLAWVDKRVSLMPTFVANIALWLNNFTAKHLILVRLAVVLSGTARCFIPRI